MAIFNIAAVTPNQSKELGHVISAQHMKRGKAISHTIEGKAYTADFMPAKIPDRVHLWRHKQTRKLHRHLPTHL